jgi:nucleotide-binding universal stress UspA family protein
MSSQTQKKILLAVDGSEDSLCAVRYIGKLDPFHETKVVLFNVFSGIPDSYRDHDKEPQFAKAIREVRAWEMQKRKTIQEFMDTAKDILIRSGFPQDAVVVNIHNRKKGIARDIISEAQNGYDAVVVGRRGTGKYKEIVVGSIATKIIEKLTFLPVLIIDQIPHNKKILMALDSSENSKLAVDYVAKTLGGFDFSVTLLHVIRGARYFQAEIPDLFLPKPDVESAKKEINEVFDQAKQCLIKAGFKANQIDTTLILNAQSRAGSIVYEAKEGDYGTIVLGRRGLSKVQDFFLGSVSNKVVHTLRNRALWMVA